MLPQNFRFWLFDHLSKKTMRFVTAVPARSADGLTKRVYDMIKEDFFVNGSLTSRSRVPELMAAIWTAGREAMLVEDKVDRTTKDAICALLSQINDCPYCGDMLISLVHAGGDHQTAKDIFLQDSLQTEDELMRRRLEWTQAVAGAGTDKAPDLPFDIDQLPEVFGSLLAMNDINRFSHIVMADTPVNAPLGSRSAKATALRLFGSELTATRQVSLEHGRALALLPAHPLPADLAWAETNPRVAQALASYVGTVEAQARAVITPAVRETVAAALADWNGEVMPISRSWVKPEVAGLSGRERAIAELTIVLAKATYQVDETMVEAVRADCADDAEFIRILAWASFTGARRATAIIADRSGWQGRAQSTMAA